MRISSDQAAKAEKSSSESKAATKTRKKTPREDGDAQEAPAADVKLSHKAKSGQGETKKGAEAPTPPVPPSPDKEIKSAEILMDHVNSGKLSAEEQEMAMKRIGDIVKKYGNT